MRFASTVATLCAVAGAGAAPLLQARAVIAHDAVVGFPTTVPSGALGDAYRKFQPWLKVENGCVPFPAVDAQGNTRCVCWTTGEGRPWATPSPLPHMFQCRLYGKKKRVVLSRESRNKQLTVLPSIL